jgi:O-methyltransferase
VAIDDAIATTRWGLFVKRFFSRIELSVLAYYKRNPAERIGVGVVKEIYSREASSLAILLGRAHPVLLSPGELLNLWQQARLLQNHGGAFAEVGAFKGDSAEIVCRAKGERRFYVFEAFAGLPSPSEGVDARFREGLFASAQEQLRKRLQRYPNTTVIAGYFPETAACTSQESFSYVHLDLDLYQPTAAALQFFYQRMLSGGRIIVHDYSQCEGVWKAVDEFLADKPEEVEPMGLTQGMIRRR